MHPDTAIITKTITDLRGKLRDRFEDMYRLAVVPAKDLGRETAFIPTHIQHHRGFIQVVMVEPQGLVAII